MFYNFPYLSVGFSHEEWETMPRNHRTVIRDYYLNGRDDTATAIYDEYDTERQVQYIERTYQLRSRPSVEIRLHDFTLC